MLLVMASLHHLCAHQLPKSPVEGFQCYWKGQGFFPPTAALCSCCLVLAFLNIPPPSPPLCRGTALCILVSRVQNSHSLHPHSSFSSSWGHNQKAEMLEIAWLLATHKKQIKRTKNLSKQSSDNDFLSSQGKILFTFCDSVFLCVPE